MNDQSTPIAQYERRSLIESFERLAHHVSKRYAHWSLDRDDLFQIAMLAAINAVDRYDPATGVPLDAHVVIAMKFELGHEMRRLERFERSTGPLVVDPAAPVEDAADADRHAELWDAIEGLPRRDKAILIKVYGLDGRAPQPKVAVGRKFHRTGPTISNSTARSIRALRTALSA